VFFSAPRRKAFLQFDLKFIEEQRLRKFVMAGAPSVRAGLAIAREARALPSPKTRQHGHASLSEGGGTMTATTTTFCSSKLEYQRLGFRGRKLKHEI
jgi:hypothetical protein